MGYKAGPAIRRQAGGSGGGTGGNTGDIANAAAAAAAAAARCKPSAAPGDRPVVPVAAHNECRARHGR